MVAGRRRRPLEVADYRGRRPEDLLREAKKRRRALLLNPRRYLRLAAAKVRGAMSLGLTMARAPLFLLVSISLFAAVFLLHWLGYNRWAPLPAFAGFGFSLAGILYAAVPWLRETYSSLPRSWRVVAIPVAVAILSLAGFSSAAVVAVVLFLGGFATAHILSVATVKLVDLGKKPSRGLSAAAVDPIPTLLCFLGVVALFLSTSIALVAARPDLLGPLGLAALGGLLGMLVGVVPTEYRLMASTVRRARALWYAFKPRRFLRDVVFTTVVLTLVGYEISVARRGDTGVTVVSLVLLLASYLLVAVRQLPAVSRHFPKPHPLLLPSFGSLLIFAPSLVLLTSGAPTITYIYGGAEAAGLLAGYIILSAQGVPWIQRFARRIRTLTGGPKD